MIYLVAQNNVVFASKNQPGFDQFVKTYLTKYEKVTKPDIFNSTKFKKRFKTVNEIRLLYSDLGDCISFPRGILTMIPLNEYDCTLMDSKRVTTPEVSDEEIRKSLDEFELRDDQVVAVRKCLRVKRGVIQLPTAVGKSAIITSTIKQLLKVNPELKSLVIAPTLSTVKNINESLKRNNIETSIFGHPDKSLSTSVTTALVPSLISESKNQSDFLQNIGAVFYDECLPRSTKVLLSDGREVEIGQVFEDDTINEVLSYDITTCEYVSKRILRKFKTPYNNRYSRLYFVDFYGEKRGLSCTPSHKIYVKDKGYTPLKDISQGDLIKVDCPYLRNSPVLKSYFVKVTGVVHNVGRRSKYKYNIEVEDTHNYFAEGVLVSNCHHLKCDTWNELNRLLVNAEYSLGFSALSVDKSEICLNNFKDLSYPSSLVIGCSGKVVMHLDPSYYIEKGIIANPVVFRVSHDENLSSDLSWSDLVKKGLMSSSRTNKIAAISSMFSRYGRKTLILVSEKDFAFYLGEFLYRNGSLKFGISFGAGKGFVCKGVDPEGKVVYSEEDSLEVIDKLSSGDIDILIATSHADEGCDIKSLDACILACGGKKDRRIIQRVGRVLRKSKNGKYAYVVDFTDEGSSVLRRQSNKRFEIYKDIIGVDENHLFDKISYSEVESKFVEIEGISRLNSTL